MLKLLFKTTAYYIIWQKFKKHIILVLCSIILIAFIGILYEDLFKVFKETNKDSVGILLFFKWFLIFIVIAFNIYTLRKTKVIQNTKNNKEETRNKSITRNEILTKEKILSSTDMILKKYSK